MPDAGAAKLLVEPVHTAVAGRARLRLAALRGNPSLKRALEAGLGGNGVRSASASTATGTVLIHFDPAKPLAEIERRVREVARAKPAPQTAAIASDMPAWHTLSPAAALAALGSGPEGLGEERAHQLRRRQGSNILPALSRRSHFDMLCDQFRSLPVALLAGTAVLSLLTGGGFDALVVIGVLALNGVIGFSSEAWTEAAITSLESGDLPPVRVLRDGSERVVPAEDLVPGDVIALRRDELVPADARVIAADGLTVNEASLTGESLPVAKAPNVLAAGSALLADRHNMLFRGSVVTGGSGRAVVVATGDRTEISRVQALVGTAMRPETPLQQQLTALTRLLVIGAVAAAAAMLLLGILRGQRLLSLLRSAVSLGVAAVPEGLPTMVTTSLAVASHRLSRRQLLVRRYEALEALGTVGLVCFDKTGTLTLNRMSVTRLFWREQQARIGDGTAAWERDPDLARLVEICVSCSDAEVVAEPGGLRFDGSPTETALLEMARRLGQDCVEIRRRRPRLAALERAEGRRYMLTVHGHAGERTDGRRLVAVKGDPLAVLSLCRRWLEGGQERPLDEKRRDAVAAENLAQAQAGLRVLGIACRFLADGEEPDDPAADLVWLGLVGMADPIRRGVPQLLRALQQAGVATVMLTGDQRATAVAIAAEAGLMPADAPDKGAVEVIEADALAEMLDRADLGTRSHRIFARLTPAQKLAVVAGLQRSGVRVAMVGDGVNDTPALKTADVGITLAASATAVARDAADIVLLGDDLSPLVEAFAAGRAVRRNVRRGSRFLVATNLSEILVMLFATATGLARPLTSAQLLWINLLSDVLPAIGLALEPPGDDALAASAEGEAAGVLSGRDVGLIVRDAAVIAGSALAAETWAAARRGPDTGAAVGFAGLMTGQLVYALACRPRSGGPPGAAFTGMLGGAFAVEAAALFLPGLRNISGGRLGAGGLALAVTAGLAPLLLAPAPPPSAP